MVSSRARNLLLTFGIAGRGLIAGAALWIAAWLVLGPGAYMAALVAGMCAAIACADAVRVAGRRERLLLNFAEALASGAVERPASTGRADRAIAATIERAAARIEADRRTIRAKLDRLAALADTAGIPLYMLDDDGGISFANRAARRLLPTSADRFSVMPAVGEELGRRLEALAPGTREVAKLADGRAVLIAVTAFRTPDGESQRLVSIQALVGDLDAVELKAWQDLSRVLAHEMMNSLAPIVSMTESMQAMLARPEPADPVQIGRAVETIGRRSAALMRFIERYRQMAELPAPQLAPVALGDFVAEIAVLAAPGLSVCGIALETRVTPPDLSLHADIELLSQAVINLLKNASEAVSAQPAPHVRLTCTATPSGVEIAIADNGHGIPADTDALFLPFYTTRPGNDGIGLSIVRQVTLAHRGTISIDRLDPGTCFRLHIPLP